MLKNLTEAEKIIIVKMKTDEYYLLRQFFIFYYVKVIFST